MALKRRTPLKARPRAKGNRGELAVRDIYRAHGWTGATRNWMSGGQGGGDIINGPADVSTEVKWHERCAIWKWIAQCEQEARPTDIPLVVCRSNTTTWIAVMPWDEFHALHQLADWPVYTIAREKQTCPLFDLFTEAQAKALLAGPDFVGAVQFRRPASGWYTAAPLLKVLPLIRQRETA